MRTSSSTGGVLLGGLLAALGLATACSSEARGSDEEGDESSVPAPATTRAQAHEAPATLALDGTLLADEESRLGPLVAGRVVEVMVERGAIVEEGQPLARLRDVEIRNQLDSARAMVVQAEAAAGVSDDGAAIAPEEHPDVRAALAQLELADQQFQRSQGLSERGVISADGLDQARARAETAREQHRSALQRVRAATAALANARAQLRQASTSLEETVVRAPFAGEIADRTASVGELVSAQSALFTLVRTDPVRIELQVPERNLLDVRPGQAVTVRASAVPGRTFAGTVRYVSASVDRASRNLLVEAVVPNSDRTLRPGLFVDAEIDLGRREEVVNVPARAVVTNAGVSRVFVIANGRVEERVVTIRSRDEENATIGSGLTAGETVAVDRLDSLFDGAQVRAERE